MKLLMDVLNDYWLKAKGDGDAEIAAATGFSAQTVTDCRKGHIPRPKTAYVLAVAAGTSEEVAREISRACDPKLAKEQAS